MPLPLDHHATLRPFVQVSTAEVRLADLVNPMPTLDPRLGKVVILRLPNARKTYRLPSGAVVDLIQRRIPGIAVSAPTQGTVRFDRVNTGSARKSTMECWKTTRTIQAGAPLLRTDVEPAACLGGKGSARVRYDGNASMDRVTDTLSPGTYLGRAIPLEQDAVSPNTDMTLRSSTGLVVVERQVWTMQAGRNGRKVFVRDSDGHVQSVRLSISQAGE